MAKMDYESIAKVFRGLGHAARIAVVDVLKDAPGYCMRYEDLRERVAEYMGKNISEGILRRQVIMMNQEGVDIVWYGSKDTPDVKKAGRPTMYVWLLKKIDFSGLSVEEIKHENLTGRYAPEWL